MLNSTVPQQLLPPFVRSNTTKHRAPRFVVRLLVGIAMLIIVRFNTIVHPFTLADNRHYMFYVFRILLIDPTVKYAVVPIYIFCAWATITSLGGPSNDQSPPRPQAFTSIDRNTKLQLKHPPPPSTQVAGYRVSFVLIWLLATSLSLITAPLVEPRYFIVPWLFWRLHMHAPLPQTLRSTPNSQTQAARQGSYTIHDHRLWLETIWFFFINMATGYVFLYRGFEWPQEPGKVQRFMW